MNRDIYGLHKNYTEDNSTAIQADAAPNNRRSLNRKRLLEASRYENPYLYVKLEDNVPPQVSAA